MAESIITVKRRTGFTVLPNSTLRDKRLSLKTRAILAIMVSMPEDWDYTISGLAAVCGAGRDAVRSALRELEDSGYLTRVQLHDDAGHFSRNEYIVTDEPTGEGCSPLSENPLTGEPLTGNPTQQNKDCTNTPYSPPEGDTQTPAQKCAKQAPDWTLFDRFWELYPKKKGKDQARRVWKQLNPDLTLCRIMSAALKKDRNSWDWRKQGGAYIPYPATWLRNRRWEDEHNPSESGPGAPPDEPLRGKGVTYL